MFKKLLRKRKLDFRCILGEIFNSLNNRDAISRYGNSSVRRFWKGTSRKKKIKFYTNIYEIYRIFDIKLGFFRTLFYEKEYKKRTNLFVFVLRSSSEIRNWKIAKLTPSNDTDLCLFYIGAVVLIIFIKLKNMIFFCTQFFKYFYCKTFDRNWLFDLIEDNIPYFPLHGRIVITNHMYRCRGSE